MGSRVAIRAVESAHHTESGHELHAFFMVHGSEAVLPTDIDYDSPRVRAYTKEGNLVALEDAIDQLDEVRDVALLRSAK
jgi:hypothetical protein